MYRYVLGWIAIIGSLAAGIALIIFGAMGQIDDRGLIIRGAIVCPVVLLIGVAWIRNKPNKVDSQTPT
jgi:hypothetical protein